MTVCPTDTVFKINGALVPDQVSSLLPDTPAELWADGHWGRMAGDALFDVGVINHVYALYSTLMGRSGADLDLTWAVELTHEIHEGNGLDYDWHAHKWIESVPPTEVPDLNRVRRMLEGVRPIDHPFVRGA